MSRWNMRSLFARASVNHTLARDTRTASAGLLREFVGRALGLRGGRVGPECLGFEQLEERKLLDGDFGSAVVITLDGQNQGFADGTITPTVPSSNNDYYRFQAPANGFVSVLADTRSITPASTLNTRVQVFSENDLVNPVVTGTNNGTLTTGLATDGWAGFIAQSGVNYFVIVSNDGSTGSTALSYRLQINAQNLGFEMATDTGIAREQGSPPPGVPVPPLRPVLGSLTRLQQDHIYAYTVPTETNFDSLASINAIVTQANLAIRLDSRVEVYRASGTSGAVALVTSDSDAGRLNDAFTTLKTTPGETVYIRVRSDEINPGREAVGTGSYFLVLDGSAEQLPQAMNPITRRGGVPGGAFVGFGAPTTPPTPNVPNPSFQTAMFRFIAQGSGLTIITGIPTGLAPVSDPALRLFDSNGNLLAFNDNFAGASAQIEMSLIGGREYYVILDGFEINSQVQFQLWIEANHTFQPAVPLDDHLSTSDLGGLSDIAQRRLLEQATGIVFNTPFPTLDGNQNIVRDRGLRTNGTAQGRIHSTGDTDIFQFTAPRDMLSDYAGDNDDLGTALFIGGRFDTADPNTVFPVGSRNLTTWDANDYWFTGAQFFDAANNVTYGFNDNPATPGTDVPEIYALLNYDPGTPASPPAGMNRRWLIVGGDFDLIVPSPLGPQTFRNLAVWFQNFQTGQWGWGSLGDVDGPVHALTSYLPDAQMEDPNDPSQQIDIARPLIGATPVPYLVVGGDFGDAGGAAANNIATFDVVNGWLPIGGGTDGPVLALTSYDPPDPSDERQWTDADGTTIPPTPEMFYVANTPDIPNSLIIGGSFTNVDGLAAGNIALWTGDDVRNLASGRINPMPGDPGTPPGAGFGGTEPTNFNINGPVHALTVFDPPDPDGTGPLEDPEPVLIIGGDFTNAGGITVTSLVSWGFIQGETDDTLQDYAPFLGWDDLGFNAAGAVIHALTTFNPPELNGAPNVDFRFLVVGGEFTFAGLDNIVGSDGTAWGWFSDTAGFDAPVRSLTTLIDEQEPGIATNLRPSAQVPQEVLYVGGDFAQTNNGLAVVNASRVVQYSAIRGATADAFVWSRMANGVDNADPDALPPSSVFALTAFDDGNPLEWDRHDRPATRLAITVSPSEGSFINSRVRVFDSNFRVVGTGDPQGLLYGFDRPGSETIAPPFPDPSGMLDPSLTPPPGAGDLAGIKLWAGEVYYIEVSGTGTGRYTVSVTADANPIDLNNDGIRDDVNATVREEPEEGRFNAAIRINTTLANGDGTNFVAANTQPLHGNELRNQKIAPKTPSRIQQVRDIGVISDIDDTDLWTFRAEFTGTVEIRLSTTDVGNSFAEQITDLITGVAAFRPDTKTYSSHLDSVVRIFRNDFEQIGYGDTNTAIVGDFQTVPVGTIAATFMRRDPRVVFHVVAGNNYFIQVESGQKWKVGKPQLAADRTANIDREIDWRYATGVYQLFVNQMPNPITDIDNGQEIVDDHPDTSDPNGPLATVIPIGDDPADTSTNGIGSILGNINNTPNHLVDLDVFMFIAPANGTGTITVTPLGTPAGLRPQLQIFDETGQLLGDGLPLGNNVVGFTRAYTAGQRIFLRVFGAGNTEGDYRIDISGLNVADDQPEAHKLPFAGDLPIRDFLGTGTITGRLNSAGDTDIFRFRTDQFLLMTLTARGLEATMDPMITVYEVSEDLSGRPVMMRIGLNDNINAGTTDARSTFSVTPSRRLDPPLADPAREYPYYYVVVSGSNPQTHFGNYDLTITFPATDDHPDADTNADAIYDTGEFSFASEVLLDTTTGLGNSSGNLELATDTDLFFFTAPASGSATIVLARGSTGTLRVKLSALDASANVLATSTADDTLLATSTSITFTVTRGTRYYLAVDRGTPNTNTTTTGTYTLAVTTPPIDDYANIGEWSLAGNIAINPATGIGQLGGNAGGDPSNPVIRPNIDTDLFTFRVLNAGDQTITVTPFATGLGTLAPRITVFASAGGAPIATIDASAQGQPVTFTITGASVNAQYWVLVEALGSGDAEGEYNINVTGPAPITPPPVDDPAAIDFNAPTVLTLDSRTGDGSRNDSINVVNDRDLFTFTTTAAGRTFVQLIAPNGSLLRASLRILSAANEDPGSTVAFDADGLPGAIANVSFTAAANTQYWVIVDGLGDSVGAYTIRVNTLPVTQRLYFPEGYTSNSIREFVSIINPNAVDAQYSVILRYEFGQLETVIANGTVRANARDGLTINDATFYRSPGVVADVPYSIIVESSLPLGATLAHYDFGTSIGDSFTERLSSTWHFARVERDPGNIRDFVVFYNPNNFGVTVTLTAYQTGGTAVSLTRDFGALRRGGFAINDIAEFPIGTFSVVLTARATNSSDQAAFMGVVASQSHYDTGRDAGYAAMGDPDAGAKRGVITNLSSGTGITSELAFFNATDTPATINLQGTFVRSGLPQTTRVLSVAPRSQLVLSGTTLGIVSGQPVGFTYTSDVAVSAQSFQIQLGDGDATTPATEAARRFYFGDAFLDTTKAGTLYFETLYFHNPTAVNASVDIRLVFLDGVEDPTNTDPLRNRTVTINIPARGYAEFRLHERREILDRPTTLNWFAVDTSSNVPVIATMTHYDLVLGGGWATSGVAFGFETPLPLIP